MDKKNSYQNKHFDVYAQALKKNVLARKLKKKEVEHGNIARRVDSPASSRQQDD